MLEVPYNADPGIGAPRAGAESAARRVFVAARAVKTPHREAFLLYKPGAHRQARGVGAQPRTCVLPLLSLLGPRRAMCCLTQCVLETFCFVLALIPSSLPRVPGTVGLFVVAC